MQLITIMLAFKWTLCWFSSTFAMHYHPCLPCQREVDWRQGTNCCFVAFCLRYAQPFYNANFSAVKTEGLLYHPSLSTTSMPSLVKGELLLLSFAQPTIEKFSHQHHWKHFPYRQGINIFVSVSVQLHWHWPFKKTPLTWDICTNLRTCSVKRPCIDKIYNVQVVIRV